MLGWGAEGRGGIGGGGMLSRCVMKTVTVWCTSVLGSNNNNDNDKRGRLRTGRPKGNSKKTQPHSRMGQFRGRKTSGVGMEKEGKSRFEDGTQWQGFDRLDLR